MLERIGDLENNYSYENDCLHPEHRPPMHIVLKPGKYKNTCPECKKETYFTVPNIIG